MKSITHPMARYLIISYVRGELKTAVHFALEIAAKTEYTRLVQQYPDNRYLFVHVVLDSNDIRDDIMLNRQELLRAGSTTMAEIEEEADNARLS
jgi:hypothetical protein